MPLLLRKIKKPRWNDTGDLPWLPKGSLPADPLADLNTQGNKLSVWQVADDKSNLEQILIALATTTEHTDKMDYALLDQNLLAKIGVHISQVAGNSFYKDANVWHRNLVEMSADKVILLAKTIMQLSKRVRIPERKVLSLLQQAVDSGKVNRYDLHPDIEKKLN